MQNLIHRWISHWRGLLADRSYRISLLAGLILALIALILNFRASIYTSSIPVLKVGDVVLDHLPTLDLRPIYTTGIFIVMAVMTLYPLLFRPEIVPFTLKNVSFFILIRAAFISMTHLGAPEGFYALTPVARDPTIIDIFYLNDLFFSGHTGMPFLGALLFWSNLRLRNFLIGMTILQGATVLLMHIHYSIDVFSAPFFTYAIFVFSDRFFQKFNTKFKKIVQRIELRFRFREKLHALRSVKFRKNRS